MSEEGLTKHQQEQILKLAEELGGKKPNFCLLYQDKNGGCRFEFMGELAILYGLACGATKLVGDKFSEIVNRPRETQAGLVPKPFKPEIVTKN